MRNLMSIVLLASVASCGVFSPVLAADEPVCHDLATARKDNDAFTFVEIKGDDKEHFLANYNATEPVTDHHPDEVWVAFLKGEDNVHVILVDVGCISSQDAVPTKAFLKMMTDIPGNPA